MKFVKNAINLLKWPTHLLVVGAQLKITFQTLWQIKRNNKTENKENRKKSRNLETISLLMLGAMLRSNFLFPGSHFSLEYPECRDRDSPSDVPTVGNQTIKGKIAQNSNQVSNMEREADLVKDKESTEYIYFDSSQLGDCYEYKENTK